MPKLKIDNREIEVPPGTKVIEAAERLGIVIPRFCYHPALGSVGACRVCAVSFREGPIKGIQMSCMVNAMDGMVVSTTDAEAMDFRRHVIEWLMLNHPHDCPVCDEGGHCLLQDMTVSGGHGLRRYLGPKRTHRDQYLGPLVQHEMNRCIQCYRCSRFYQQYTGYRDLGVMGIGTRVYFGRSKPGKLESPFAGNLIDICPTGVYTDKPSRFIGRRWDFQRAPAVCLHCSLGCNLVASARYREVVRHEAQPNTEVNGHFICDRGRYAYPYANASDRPRQAMVKGETTTVAEALTAAGRRLQEISAQAGPQSVAVIGSTRCSLETLAAVRTLCRKKSWQGPVFHSDNRRAVNSKAAVGHLTTDLAVSLGAVSVADTIVVLGADPLNEAPMLALSLRQAGRKGAHVTVVDPRPVELPLAFDHWPVHTQRLGGVIRGLIGAVGGDGLTLTPAAEDGPGGMAAIQSLAGTLVQKQRVVIVCGTDITSPEEIELAAQLAHALRQQGVEAKLFYLLDGPNAFTAGLLMETDPGVDRILDGIEAGSVKALVVVESDLWNDYGDRGRLIKGLDSLELLIACDHISSPLTERAHILLPTQTVYEAGGRWINQEGRLQYSRPVFSGGEPIRLTGSQGHPPRIFEKEVPGGQPAAAWRLVARLAASEGRQDANVQADEAYLAEALEALGTGWEQLTSGRIDLGATDAQPATPDAAVTGSSDGSEAQSGLTLLMVDWTFGTQYASAHSPVLGQVTPPARGVMHPRTAEDLGVGQAGQIVISTEKGRLMVPFGTDDRMAPGVLVVPRHSELAWQELGGTKLILDRTQVKAFEGSDGKGRSRENQP